MGCFSGMACGGGYTKEEKGELSRHDGMKYKSRTYGTVNFTSTINQFPW